MEKACTKCREIKPLEEFGKRNSTKDGRRGECKVCIQAFKRLWDAENKDAIRRYHENWRDNNPENYKAVAARTRKKALELGGEALREARRMRYREWLSANRSVAQAASANWRRNNPDKLKEYAAKNTERKVWRDQYAKNPEASRAKTRRYQASKLRACPPWLTHEHHEQILQVYREAEAKTLETGQKHHVDHIFPLKGKNFSGLHVPWNLQVLPAKENLSKNNRVTPGMLAIVEIF